MCYTVHRVKLVEAMAPEISSPVPPSNNTRDQTRGPEVEFDNRLHDGKFDTKYQDFRTIDDAIDYARGLPRRSSSYLVAYGDLNPDSGSDEESSVKGWRTISQLARPDYYNSSRVEDRIYSDADNLFDTIEGVRVSVRGV
jgi:hypothetical protein